MNKPCGIFFAEWREDLKTEAEPFSVTCGITGAKFKNKALEKLNGAPKVRRSVVAKCSACPLGCPVRVARFLPKASA